MKRILSILAVVVLALTARSAVPFPLNPQGTLAWTDTQTNVTWQLYGSMTNAAGTNRISVSGITNKSIQVFNVPAGLWVWYVTAKSRDTNSFESDPSNVVWTPTPAAPTSFGMVAMQYSFDINAPFTNATQIYFRMVPTVITNGP